MKGGTPLGAATAMRKMTAAGIATCAASGAPSYQSRARANHATGIAWVDAPNIITAATSGEMLVPQPLPDNSVAK